MLFIAIRDIEVLVMILKLQLIDNILAQVLFAIQIMRISNIKFIALIFLTHL